MPRKRDNSLPEIDSCEIAKRGGNNKMAKKIKKKGCKKCLIK